MKTNCESIRQLVSSQKNDNRFLAVIDGDGFIQQANERMVNGFHLHDARSSFFELIHPIHSAKFRSIIQDADNSEKDTTVELYLRNGMVHPMKWRIQAVSINGHSKQLFFCEGFKIIDDDRLEKFNRITSMNYEMGMDGPVCIMFHDVNGELIAMNQQTVEMFGLTMERLYKLENIRDLWNNEWRIHNENDQPVFFEDAPFRKTFKSNRVEKLIIKIKTENGATRWILFHSQVLPPDEVTGELFSVSNVIDITNERSLIESLSENESLYSSFFKQMPGISWIVNQEERLIFASESFFQQYSLERMDALNEKLVELVPPSVSNALYEHHLRVFKDGEPQELMQNLKIADGTRVLYHIRLFIVNSINGTKLVGGLAIPISDNNKMEMELREANEKLVLLRRATSDAIWEWDMQTGAMIRNDALKEMVGYNSEATGGLAWWLRRIHPDDRNRVGDKVKDATEKHQHSWEDSYRFKCANGDYKFVRDKGFVIYENGLPVKMIGSLTDVSNLKDLEGALENEKLLKQKEISETAIRVQESERTRIGHELHDNVNQILSSAKLFMDMFKPGGSEQRQLKEKSIEYVTLAIEEIRKLSKELAAPRLKVDGLGNSIQTIISDMKMASSIQFSFVHDEACELLSSGKKITIFRIVQEQLKNILKHSKARKATIRLQIINEEVELKIKDDGTGFDTKRSSGGIGLSNIYERTQFYNGRLSVVSEKGKGCELVVNLPL